MSRLSCACNPKDLRPRVLGRTDGAHSLPLRKSKVIHSEIFTEYLHASGSVLNAWESGMNETDKDTV